MRQQNNPNSYLKIRGGQALKGEVTVSGAKNAILPLLFASLLAKGDHKFKNVPCLSDVQNGLKMLSSLGLICKSSQKQLLIKNNGLKWGEPCPQSAKSFRASVLCLGPLLAVFGKIKVPLPGGCLIGERPIDLHLKGLGRLGAKIFIKKGFIYGSAPKEGLRAAKIKLDFPSVGATENLIMASVLAKGVTYLQNIACEPEITELIDYLKNRGACIEQSALRELKITGVSRLKTVGKVCAIIPDRIEAGTWLIAGACSKGELLVKKCRPDHLNALLEKLKQAGFIIKTRPAEIFLKSGKTAKAVDIKTGVYPSFPTDLQAQFMALMTQLKGPSSLKETIFENRFRYIKPMNLLGAGALIKGPEVFVKGPVVLKGNKISATDLRAGAGLALAALTARGESRLYGLHHIERGYENFVQKLKSLNADLELCAG